MEEPKFEIPIDEPKAEFTKHLELPHNKRIIFSAPFGTGKTYFLDRFFKDRPEKVIHLFPVNYSVSSNEDVFELIKFDILFQLMEDEDLKLEDNTFSDFFTSQFFLFNNAERFVEWLLNKVGRVGQNIVKLADTIEQLVKEYEKFKDRMNTNPSKDVAFNFLSHLKNKKGSAYEEDAITQLIQSFVQQVCDEERQCILIIDDLDRIDPEHTFRLLNVFAAHFDIGAPDTNKFCFDKVIFVCDVNNIRNIFHAKYGTETDFAGYIDKFYSKNIFYFINKWATRGKIEEIILQADFDNLYIDSFGVQSKENHNWMMLIEILNILCQDNVLNLRTIEKIKKLPIHAQYKKSKQEDYSSNYNEYKIFLLFDILVSLVNDSQKILQSFKRNSEKTHFSCQINSTTKQFFIPKHNIYFSNLIIVLADYHGQLVPNATSYIDEPSGIRFNFSPVNSYDIVTITMDSDKLEEGKNHVVDLYDFLLRAFEIHQKL